MSELHTTLKTIETYFAKGWKLEYFSSCGWDIAVYSTFENVPKSKRGSYDLIFSKGGDRVGLELKYNLTPIAFYTGLGQCLTRMAMFEKEISKVRIVFSKVTQSNLRKFEKTIAMLNMPITLEHIPLTEDENTHRYWYDKLRSKDEMLKIEA